MTHWLKENLVLVLVLPYLVLGARPASGWRCSRDCQCQDCGLEAMWCRDRNGWAVGSGILLHWAGITWSLTADGRFCQATRLP